MKVSILGPRNPFLISCVLITGLTWAVVAMNGMSAAFIVQTCANCSEMISLVDEVRTAEIPITDEFSKMFAV